MFLLLKKKQWHSKATHSKSEAKTYTEKSFIMNLAKKNVAHSQSSGNVFEFYAKKSPLIFLERAKGARHAYTIQNDFFLYHLRISWFIGVGKLAPIFYFIIFEFKKKNRDIINLYFIYGHP